MATSKTVSWDHPVSARVVGGEDQFTNLRAREYEQDATILVIDAKSLAYRAWHSNPHLSSRVTYLPTSVVYGMLFAIQDLCSAANTRRFVLVWDGHDISYKRAIYPEYKCRHTTDKSLEMYIHGVCAHLSMRVAINVFSMMGVPQILCPCLEADDTAGLIVNHVRQHLDEGTIGQLQRILLCTEDKDWFQLIDDETHVWRTIQGDYIDKSEFESRFGFHPCLFADWKSLVGESSNGDNIPGAPGVGEKRASKYVTAYGNYKGVIAGCGKLMASKLAKKTDISVYENRRKVIISYYLSKIMQSEQDLLEYKKFMSRVTKSEKKLSASVLDGLRATIRRECDLAMMQSRDVCAVAYRVALGVIDTTDFDLKRWKRVCGYRVLKPNKRECRFISRPWSYQTSNGFDASMGDGPLDKVRRIHKSGWTPKGLLEASLHFDDWSKTYTRAFESEEGYTWTHARKFYRDIHMNKSDWRDVGVQSKYFGKHHRSCA